MKRESGAFVNKAPACTKTALKQMMVYLYSTAYTSADYQDAALLCLLWFLFGRASDLTMLRKANLSIGAGDIFFVRFIWVKTAEEQGLSLFPDDDFSTCPLLAIALALVTQSSPTASLLSQLSEPQTVSRATLTPATPLIDLIDHPEAVTPLHQTAKKSDESKTADAAPGIHSYVNRVLDRVAKNAGVAERLTSHSFRRGGAQHANGAGIVEHDGDDQSLRGCTSLERP
uniref:Tyr recombinase domain-containing protein n=1 Tax=Phytophthora ramorum TaxID=164328 RepID=H3H739_PHYRM